MLVMSLDYLVWNKKSIYFLNYADKILRKLYTNMKDKDLLDLLVKGRIPKGSEFDRSIIVGDDGGLYLLLNSLNNEDIEALKPIVGEDYLKDKIHEENKAIIGEGGFGKVRFALSLMVTRKKCLPG